MQKHPSRSNSVKHSSRSLTSNSRKELIPIITSEEMHLIDARTLHDQLGVQHRFNDWIQNRIKEFGFMPDEDYYIFSKIDQNAGNGIFGKNQGRKPKEYHLTIDMAKEIAMLERSPMGRVIRQYFIEAEKALVQKRLYAQVSTVTEARKKCNTLQLGDRTLYHYRDALRLLGYSTKGSATKIKQTYGNQMMLVNRKYYVSEEYLKLMISRATARQQKKHTLQASPVALPENFGSPLNLAL